MAKMSLTEAAEIMQATYHGTTGDETVSGFDVAGAQAVLLKRGDRRILVIPGTNERSDWTDFNFDLLAGDSGTNWHAGFMRHARLVYTFAKMADPHFIIGHSLGAASAQIVGMSLRRPTIAFASPRPMRSREQPPGAGWVVNICRTDDAVCWVPPPLLGFHHVGSSYWLSPDEPHVGEDHRIDKYISLLGLARIAEHVPQVWPR